jgi:hypothetical protein
MNKETLRRLMGGEDKEEETPPPPGPAVADRLLAALRAYLEPPLVPFAPGHVVRQKPGCRLYEDRGPHGLWVVMRLLNSKEIEKLTAAGSRQGYHQLLEPPDLLVGCVDDDDDLFLIPVASARFELVGEETVAALGKPEEEDEDEAWMAKLRPAKWLPNGPYFESYIFGYYLNVAAPTNEQRQRLARVMTALGWHPATQAGQPAWTR